MNPIRSLRRRAGVSQAALARAAGTSQPTIAAYESLRKSPTLNTVQRLAAALGLEAVLEFHSRLTREDRRSLALHHAIVKRLEENPEDVLRRARGNLRRMEQRHPEARQLLREWRVLLGRPVAALAPVLVSPDPWARELRHVTPFAGVLTAAERAAVYREFAEEEAAK